MDIEKICNEVLDELTFCCDIEMSLRNSFITVIKYLNQFPKNLSVRSKNNIPDVKTLGELNKNRKKPFNNNPLMISQKLYNSVSFLLVTIRSQGIYEEAEVKKAVSKCEQIIKNLNAQDFTNQISDLLGNLSDIARYIDVSQRRI